MQNIKLNLKSCKSVIHCGDGAFEKFAPSEKRLFVVTDTNVFKLYENKAKSVFFNAHFKVIRAGERSKNFNVLKDILSDMSAFSLKRGDRVVAFGGGVVGDIAGLAASLYMRGVELVQIPTTLLAQVDSSVGGKTAVDFDGVKNLIGAFYQPKEVIIDPAFLKTLPKKQIVCGLGEIIKYGALNKEIFKKLENAKNLFDLNFLKKVIPDCIRHKKSVVVSDERDEGGARKSLNLGHTTGHALELCQGKLTHGAYVLTGTYYETFIYEKLYGASEYSNRLKKLILSVIKVLPIDDINAVLKASEYDKKNEKQGLITIISPSDSGEWKEIKLKKEEYGQLLLECSEKLRGEL